MAQKEAEHSRLWQSAQALDRQGKLDEAIAAAESVLTIDREVLGDVHDMVADLLA